MRPISFKRHRFPLDVIRHAVWLHFRFTLSIRDVEELLAQRGVEVSREAVRCWVNKFGPLIAANLRRGRERPTGRWHLDGCCQTNRYLSLAHGERARATFL
jgi:putative transposase